MARGNILIIRWGQVRIHDYYLANLLREKGYEVGFVIYTPSYAYKNDHISALLKRIKDNFSVFEFKESFLKKMLIRFNTILNKIFHKSYLPFYTGYLLPLQLKHKINLKQYNYLIPIEQASLYWITRAMDISEKLIYYSLEIQKKGDDDIDCNFEALLRYEYKAIHLGLYALIIQDKFRAEALIGDKVDNFKFRIIYLPVFVEGDIYTTRNNYFHSKFGIDPSKKVLLYFGEVYEERKLSELIDAFKGFKTNDYVLVFHGSKRFKDIVCVEEDIIVSDDFLPFDQLDVLISSAYIGLAFYDNDKLNSKYTAFSSEKVTRYLQCGIPYIAFDNESYQRLNSDSPSGYLINGYIDLENAVLSINHQYGQFSQNAFQAFNLFSRERSLESLDTIL